MYSSESDTPIHWPHRDLRVSADAVAVSNDLHSYFRPQAILKVRPPNSLDYGVRYEPQSKCMLATTKLEMKNFRFLFCLLRGLTRQQR